MKKGTFWKYQNDEMHIHLFGHYFRQKNHYPVIEVFNHNSDRWELIYGTFGIGHAECQAVVLLFVQAWAELAKIK